MFFCYYYYYSCAKIQDKKPSDISLIESEAFSSTIDLQQVRVTSALRQTKSRATDNFARVEKKMK